MGSNFKVMYCKNFKHFKSSLPVFYIHKSARIKVYSSHITYLISLFTPLLPFRISTNTAHNLMLPKSIGAMKTSGVYFAIIKLLLTNLLLSHL